jgi:hypothetical protein
MDRIAFLEDVDLEAEPIGNAAAGLVLDPDTDTVVRGTVAVAGSSGTATIDDPDTSVVVAHELASTPDLRDVQVTPTNDLGDATKFWIDGVDETDVTIAVDQTPGVGNTAKFVWRVLSVAHIADPDTDYAVEVAADSPFAWWRMEETTGTTIADEQGTHHGNLIAGADPAIAGKVGSALRFDGINQYASLGALGNFGTDMQAACSMECWLRWSGTGIAWAAGVWNNGTSLILDLVVNGDANDASQPGRVAARRRTGAGGRGRTSARSDLNDGQWHHVVVTYSGSGATPDIYIDGVLDNGTSRTFGGGSGGNFGHSFVIGAVNARGTLQSFFPGDVDEFALYLAALGADRVSAHHDAG